MKKLLIAMAGMALSANAMAAASSFVELAYIEGGENAAGTPSAEQDGLEVAGAWAITDMWYIGGKIGNYEVSGAGGAENDYYNFNGGAAIGITDAVDMIAEVGLWAGEQDIAGVKTDPKAVELKLGVNAAISDNFSLFGTISTVTGDLDVPTNDDITSFVWSAGGAYKVWEGLYLSLAVVEGANGVNGQSDVARVAIGWDF